MNGLLNFRLLGSLAALPMLAAPVYGAEPLEQPRFSNNNTQFSDTSRLVVAPPRSMAQADFVLAPSGATSKAGEKSHLNINSLDFKPMNGVSVSPRPRPDAIETPGELNKIYSKHGRPAAVATACASPSPMKPTEIEALVGATAEAYGVDPKLAKAIAWAESRFDQTRNSPKGARGAMQLMPETAFDLGVSDVCDPRSNIDGGIRHLRSLIDEFRNPLVVAAAYNAGRQAIYDNDGIPPYGETIRYVAVVFNRQLGLQIRPATPADTSKTLPASKSSPLRKGPGHVIGKAAAEFVNGVMHF